MSGLYLGAIIAIAVIAMVIAIAKFKMHPFVVLILVAIFVGLASGMSATDVVSTVKTGFGSILGNIGIVIVCGTIIGKILEKTGAALTMANSILRIVGKKNGVTAMGLTGYVTGIPVFCDSGFVVLSPISRALAHQSKNSLAVMAVALSGGLYATHCLVPPTPGPIAMAGTLHADLGLTILVGLAISIPAVACAIIYAKKVASKVEIPANPEFTVEELVEKYGKLPGALHSFSPILLPIVLIAINSIASFPSKPFGSGTFASIATFIGNPVVALILGVFLAMTLIPKAEKGSSLKWFSEGVVDAAPILVITGAGGAFGAILKQLPLAEALSGSLLGLGIGVFVPFIIAALLKTAMGASTVAMIVTSSMIAPLMPSLGFTSELAKVLVVLAIGTGSMFVSHANDSFFWVVSQFSDMNTKQAYKCQTGMTAVMGVVSILVIFVLSLFV